MNRPFREEMRNEMKFFTDHTVENDYLLVKIDQYLKLPNNTWKEIFIDPGVYDLVNQPYYSWEKWIDIGLFLDGLPENCYFSADYPCDMNLEYTEQFLLKSWDNAVLYGGHPQYIVTVQSKFNDYWDFIHWFDLYNDLSIESGIIGLGNFCRIHHLTEFMKHSLDYAFKHCKHPRIHVYGLGLKIIPYANKLAKRFEIELSVDSTKWTRDPIIPGKPSCRASNKQEYFDKYMRIIKERL